MSKIWREDLNDWVEFAREGEYNQLLVFTSTTDVYTEYPVYVKGDALDVEYAKVSCLMKGHLHEGTIDMSADVDRQVEELAKEMCLVSFDNGRALK